MNNINELIKEIDGVINAIGIENIDQEKTVVSMSLHIEKLKKSISNNSSK